MITLLANGAPTYLKSHWFVFLLWVKVPGEDVHVLPLLRSLRIVTLEGKSACVELMQDLENSKYWLLCNVCKCSSLVYLFEFGQKSLSIAFVFLFFPWLPLQSRLTSRTLGWIVALFSISSSQQAMTRRAIPRRQTIAIPTARAPRLC